MFEQATSDVVLLLDCCAAASSTGEAGGSLTELIAACGFENEAPGVGEHSFTRSLIEELRGWNHHSIMSVAKLHSEVLARIKHWKPRYASNGNCERRNTPVYVLLANEGKPRSIELTPLKHCNMSNLDTSSTGPLHTPENSDEDVEMSEVSDGNITPSSHLSDSLTALSPGARYPKVMISVALEEDQVLHTRDWCEWLKSVPAIVKFARVEGIYKSDSTLLIMTIPVVIWDLIPPDPAIKFLGFVKSDNLLKCSEIPDSEATNLQTSQHSVLDTRASNFSVPIRINDNVCKASIRPGAPSSAISSACVERWGMNRLIDKGSSNLSLSQEPAELLGGISHITLDIGTVTLSYKFMIVEGKDATVSLGADFLKTYHGYIDEGRQLLIINGKEVKLLVESEHLDNTETSHELEPEKPTILPKRGVTQEFATSAASSTLEAVDTKKAQVGSPKAKIITRSQQQVNGFFTTQNFYQPLHTDKTIRLVVLEPASDYYASIQCSLRVVSLDEAPLYEALSYVWGDPNCTSSISLNGTVIQVTLGLERALRHLRHSRHEALVVWIDAICIDQRNIEERSSQIQLMGSIYRQARRVLVWLGEETATSSMAIAFLERLNTECTLFELGDSLSSVALEQPWSTIRKLEFSSSWESLGEFFSRPWWKRLWVLQEVALAHEVTMQCGNLQFDFALVARPAALMSILMVDYEHAESHAVQDRIPDNIKQTIDIWLRAVRNLVTLKVRLNSSSGLHLMAALRYYFSYKCTDPRDMIYGLVGLVQQQTALEPILPDYRLTTDLVFLQAAHYILDAEQNLEILSWKSYEHPTTEYDLPSWAPDWTKIREPCPISARWPPSLKMVASSITDKGLNVGCHETVTSKRVSVQGRILKVRGIRVDTLKEIGRICPLPRATFGQFSSLSRGNLYRAQPRIQEAASWETILNQGCGQHLNTTRLIDFTNETSSITGLPRGHEVLLVDFDEYTYPDFDRLKYISITSRGYPCFIPPESQVGDFLCVLVSAKVPFILRRTDDGSHFRLIGEW